MKNQLTIEQDLGSMAPLKEYSKQEQVTKSLAIHLIAEGGLPTYIVDESWFKLYFKEVFPNYKVHCRKILWKTLDNLSQTSTNSLVENIKQLKIRPILTVDLWTGRNHKSFMAATIHSPGGFKNICKFCRSISIILKSVG